MKNFIYFIGLLMGIIGFSLIGYFTNTWVAIGVLLLIIGFAILMVAKEE